MDRFIISNRVRGGVVCYRNSEIGNGETHPFRYPAGEPDPDIVPLSFTTPEFAWDFIYAHRDRRNWGDYTVVSHQVWDDALPGGTNA